MKFKFPPITAALCSLLFSSAKPAQAAEISPGFIYETAQEFFGSGDFDGDGRLDLVIVDKESGKYRLAYQLNDGTLTWEDNRPSGLKAVSGFSLGKLLAPKRDALAFTAPDANQLSVADVSSPTAPARPALFPFDAALGPNTVVAVAGANSSGLDDLFVSSIYNSPEPNQANLLRNTAGQFTKASEMPLIGAAVRGNRLSFGDAAPTLCVMVRGEKEDQLQFVSCAGGKPQAVRTVSGLPSGTEYAIVRPAGAPFPSIIFYKPQAKSLRLQALAGVPPEKVELGKLGSFEFELDQPVFGVLPLAGPNGDRLIIIFGEGEKAGIFNFDGVKPPALAQTIISTNEIITAAEGLPGGLIVFSHPAGARFSTRYLSYKSSGDTYAFSAFGTLPTLADNDNVTIPDIHDRIASGQKVTSASEMKIYTNSIPGTHVSYVMVPIPGGEFVMGSPEGEPGRKPDEGPQHKVKISPFWMEQCEVTWNEYELFMYPEEERRTRDTIPTDANGDKLADAVTHPSKPYVEMSFGMGKDGFPAIAMTQHAANKYCQWLSAKTGEFLRLPTEAEWEYACRAGTTGTYFFGDDASKIGEYAWYEDNSDFKYQKVGKKKPNPWGLYDMCGNVTEWVLDQYDPDFYKQCAAKGIVSDPWNKATKPYPHSVRGGSWDDAAALCRSAARRGSDRTWKMQDPQLPKSVWYFSDAQFVGFRIVRPLKVPPPEEMQKYWTSGVEKD
jgi:formylglycine-generating enzyme required for sulfatase activity